MGLDINLLESFYLVPALAPLIAVGCPLKSALVMPKVYIPTPHELLYYGGPGGHCLHSSRLFLVGTSLRNQNAQHHTVSSKSSQIWD